MNKDMIEGRWNEIKGRIKARWGALTDDQIEEIDGNYETLCGRLQRTYGWTREQTEKHLRELS
jgi:uncharacterized protein YjbJ (UPF0337 family)